MLLASICDQQAPGGLGRWQHSHLCCPLSPLLDTMLRNLVSNGGWLLTNPHLGRRPCFYSTEKTAVVGKECPRLPPHIHLPSACVHVTFPPLSP